MLIAGFDVETTGLDTKTDSIIQLGLVLWDTAATGKKAKGKYDYLVNWPNLPPLSEEILRVTGINDADLTAYGSPPGEAFRIILATLEVVDAILAHNGNIFDRPMLENNCKRLGLEPPKKLWMDSTTDIEFPPHITTRKLSHLAAEHSFVNPFPHDAICDVLTMLKIADLYDWNKTLAFAQSPTLLIKAHTTFEQKELAKKQNFKWNAEDKCWFKSIKDFQLEAAEKAAKEAGFKISILGGK